MIDKPDLAQKLQSTPGLLLIFDFDGTLAEIAPTPDAVVLNPDTVLLLRKLLERPLTNLAVISGRSIEYLRKHIPASLDVALAGCHGCEFEMPGQIEESILDDEEIFEDLETFALGLKDLESWQGIIVENKGCAVAMHYRLAEENQALHARDEFYSRASALKRFEDMEVIEGKKVIELRPFGINKGVAVRFLADSYRPSSDSLTAYFGDDTTDLDAFQALPENSIRVAIGSKIANEADYVLASPKELLETIRRLVS